MGYYYYQPNLVLSWNTVQTVRMEICNESAMLNGGSKIDRESIDKTDRE